MPEPRTQPGSREIEDVDGMGWHSAPILPQSRHGENMEPEYDPSTPLIPVDRKQTEYTQRLRKDAGPNAARGYAATGSENGDTIIETPRENDPAYSPDMPRVKWLHAAHGYALDDKLRGSNPVDPQRQKSVPDQVRKEERHA